MNFFTLFTYCAVISAAAIESGKAASELNDNHYTWTPGTWTSGTTEDWYGK